MKQQLSLNFEILLKKLIQGQKACNILDAGVGGRRWLEVTPALCGLTEKPVLYLERNPQRARAAGEYLGSGIRILDDSLQWLGTSQSFDLIYLDLLPRDLPRLFTALLPCARELLAPSGALVLNYPLQALQPEEDSLDHKIFATFLQRSSLTGTPNEPVFRALQSMGQAGEVLEAEAPHTPLSGFRYRTLGLRPNFAELLSTAAWAPSEPENFRLEQLLSFLQSIRRQAELCLPAEFVQSLQHSQGRIFSRPAHCIKHDIHHDLLSAYRLAREEAALGIRGIFFIMPPHELSDRYIERKETMELLQAMQNLGHEIGVHVDPLELELQRGGFFQELEAFLRRLRHDGLYIQCGNTHGNTRLQSKYGLRCNDFFMEVAKLRTDQPQASSQDCPVCRASLVDVFARLGLRYWFDTVIFDQGSPVQGRRLQLGDNYQRLELYDVHQGSSFDYELLLQGGPWNIDIGLQNELLQHISTTACAYLLHPQFYR